MPDTISSKNPKEFMDALCSIENIEVFETNVIQTIITYKWDKYAKKFFLYQFLVFILFLISYLLDIYFMVIYRDERSLT